MRRELAYLHLQMDRQAEAETQLERVVERAPEDLTAIAQLGLLKLTRGDEAGAMALLNRVLLGGDADLADRVRTALRMPAALRARPEEARATVLNQTDATQAKELAFKSLEKGYLQDALRYLTIAHESDPVDFEVMLKLGWANNLLKDDRDA